MNRCVDQPIDVPGLTVIRQMSEIYADAIDYRSSLLIKKSFWYVDDVAYKLIKMTKKTAVQIRDRTFSGKDPCRL